MFILLFLKSSVPHHCFEEKVSYIIHAYSELFLKKPDFLETQPNPAWDPAGCQMQL